MEVLAGLATTFRIESRMPSRSSEAEVSSMRREEGCSTKPTPGINPNILPRVYAALLSRSRASKAMRIAVSGRVRSAIIEDFLSMRAEISGHRLMFSGTPRRLRVSSTSCIWLSFMVRSCGPYHRAGRVTASALHSASISPFQGRNLLPPPFPFRSYRENIFERSPRFDAAITFAWHPRFDFGAPWTLSALPRNQLSLLLRQNVIHPYQPPNQPAAPTVAEA